MNESLEDKLIHYIKGYLIIDMKGSNIIRLINMFKNHNIYLWDIKCVNINEYTCNLDVTSFYRIKDWVRKTNTRIVVKKKCGLPFLIKKTKKHVMFFVGALLCITFLNISTNYVWAVEFVGNNAITDDELEDFLKEENIYYGIKKKKIDCEYEEKRLREKYERITWTSIYFDGTKFIVEIKENPNQANRVADSLNNYNNISEPRGDDIIAPVSGSIESILTRNGEPKVKSGDVVEKGQILVEGKIPIYDDDKNIVSYQIYDADADIIMKIKFRYNDKVNLMHSKIHYTGKEANWFFIEFMGRVYNTLSLRKFMMKDVIVYKNQLKILDNIFLPLFYGKVVCKEYQLNYIEYTNEELNYILISNFDEFILCLQEKGVQILEKNVKISRNNNNMELVSDIVADCAYDIIPLILDEKSEEE